MLKELWTRVAKLRQHHKTIMAFIFKWMQLPAAYRKTLSHEGAVRSTSTLHPIHGCDDHIGNYFDPGNKVYAMTLRAVCPELLQVGYNDNTLGDICEAWLAAGIKSSHWAARSLAAAIEGISGLMYIITVAKDIYTLAELDQLCREYD